MPQLSLWRFSFVLYWWVSQHGSAWCPLHLTGAMFSNLLHLACQSFSHCSFKIQYGHLIINTAKKNKPQNNKHQLNTCLNCPFWMARVEFRYTTCRLVTRLHPKANPNVFQNYVFDKPHFCWKDWLKNGTVTLYHHGILKPFQVLLMGTVGSGTSAPEAVELSDKLLKSYGKRSWGVRVLFYDGSDPEQRSLISSQEDTEGQRDPSLALDGEEWDGICKTLDSLQCVQTWVKRRTELRLIHHLRSCGKFTYWQIQQTSCCRSKRGFPVEVIL